MSQLRSYKPNTVPVPANALRSGAASEAGIVKSVVVEPTRDDRFPKGKIIKFFPNLSYGFVRDQIDRELFFHVDEIDLLGPRGRKEFIRIGAEVGYDICRTSSGLRVKRMKIYN